MDWDINRDSLDFGWSDWDIDKATPTYTPHGCRIGTSTRAATTLRPVGLGHRHEPPQSTLCLVGLGPRPEPLRTLPGRIGTSTRATTTHNTTQNKRERKEKEEKALSEAANAEGCLQVEKARHRFQDVEDVVDASPRRVGLSPSISDMGDRRPRHCPSVRIDGPRGGVNWAFFNF